MPRLIDADAMKESVQKQLEITELIIGRDEVGKQIIEAMRSGFLQEIDNAPTVNQWIPVTERLPGEDGMYIVCGHNAVWVANFVTIVCVKGWSNDVRNPVIEAWMPLPEPYKETPHD